MDRIGSRTEESRGAPAGPTSADLAEARLHLQQAFQLVAVGLGRSLTAPAPDDSHTSLLWDLGGRRWYGPALPGTPGFRGFLSPEDLRLGLLDGHAEVAAEHPLAGETLLGALGWLRAEVAKRGGDAPRMSLASHFEIPDHAVAKGAPFPDPGPAHRELAAHFAEAHELIDRARIGANGAAPVRTWPHHFDLGSVLPVQGDRVTVGLGFSPGDEHYGEPYYYVSPHPHPPEAEAPALEGPGHWIRRPFFAAILTDSGRREAGGSREVVAGFLERAVPLARDMAARAAAG